jgi:predicted enzyme related to lactoylglutathione lyase
MEISRHAPGSFCWCELGTTDQEAAKKFYAEIFEWETHEIPIWPDSSYTILHIGAKDIGALYQLGEERLRKGIQPHWLSYIAVGSADNCARSITASGGRLMMYPFDVFDLGKMTVAQDPTGATFAIWQPLRYIGAKIRNENNAMCWNELVTDDIAAAKDFYGRVFGWNAITKESGSTSYTKFYIGDPARGNAVGGMRRMDETRENTPPHWMVHFCVDDCSAIAEKARSLGAAICNLSDNLPNLRRIAVIRDQQGAVFSVSPLRCKFANWEQYLS